VAQVSALDAAEDGLLAALIVRAAVGGSELAGGVLFTELGEPASIKGTDAVWVREDLDEQPVQRHDSTGVGAQRKHEVFIMRVACFVAWAGDDFKTVRDRCHALAEEVELAVLANERLGGAVFHAKVSGYRRTSGALAEARGMVIDVLVWAEAYNA